MKRMPRISNPMRQVRRSMPRVSNPVNQVRRSIPRAPNLGLEKRQLAARLPGRGMVSRMSGRSRTLQGITNSRRRSCGLFGCLGLVFLCLALVVFAAALLAFYYARTGGLPDLGWLPGMLALLV